MGEPLHKVAELRDNSQSREDEHEGDAETYPELPSFIAGNQGIKMGEPLHKVAEPRDNSLSREDEHEGDAETYPELPAVDQQNDMVPDISDMKLPDQQIQAVSEQPQLVGSGVPRAAREGVKFGGHYIGGKLLDQAGKLYGEKTKQRKEDALKQHQSYMRQKTRKEDQENSSTNTGYKFQ